MKDKIQIICDDREPLSQKMFCETIDSGIELIRKRLNEGDYICGDVVVERKEINDFCSSIMDKRLEHQIENMKLKYKNIYVIIVGRIKDRTTEIDEHCILGMISSLLVKHKVSVAMVDDEFQFLYLIKRIFERHLEERDEN